jgi:hypothetical protein
MSQSTEILKNVRREIVHTTQSYDSTLKKLYSSIGEMASANWGSIAKAIQSYDKQAQEFFVSNVEENIGPHGFMIFQVSTSPHPHVTAGLLLKTIGIQPRRMASAVCARLQIKIKEDYPWESTYCNYHA